MWLNKPNWWIGCGHESLVIDCLIVLYVWLGNKLCCLSLWFGLVTQVNDDMIPEKSWLKGNWNELTPKIEENGEYAYLLKRDTKRVYPLWKRKGHQEGVPNVKKMWFGVTFPWTIHLDNLSNYQGLIVILMCGWLCLLIVMSILIFYSLKVVSWYGKEKWMIDEILNWLRM